MLKRASGVLLSISSLPSRYGIGCFSKEAYEFVDFLAAAGQTYWQILPLGPTGYGDSPYQSFSTFAGNHYFIDLETLIEEGLLTREECDAADFGDDPEHVDYGKMYNNRLPLLRKAFERSHIVEKWDFQEFIRQNSDWLIDYAMYVSIKKIFDNQGWGKWAEDIRLRYDYSMEYYWDKYHEDIVFQEFLQYEFACQWKKLKAYANSKGIRIIGDLPIYVSYDSADAWAHPDLFQFTDKRELAAVAGCPPDDFCADGQLWGNPLYRWDAHRQTGFAWWISRFRHIKELYDVVRVDHFRGFDEYFAIPAKDTTARNGRWEKGPGLELFASMERALGKIDIIAEDLGFVTPSVRKLVQDTGYPNMKVLEFGLDPENDSDHLPHHFSPNSAAYTGTHDNATLVTWYETLPEAHKKWADTYFEKKFEEMTPEERNWAFIRIVMFSVSDTCIIPMQDYLVLDDSSRMNAPSTLGTNWRWRMTKGPLTEKLQKRMFEMTKTSFRLSDAAKEAMRKKAREEELLKKAAKTGAAKK